MLQHARTRQRFRRSQVSLLINQCVHLHHAIRVQTFRPARNGRRRLRHDSRGNRFPAVRTIPVVMLRLPQRSFVRATYALVCLQFGRRRNYNWGRNRGCARRYFRRYARTYARWCARRCRRRGGVIPNRDTCRRRSSLLLNLLRRLRRSRSRIVAVRGSFNLGARISRRRLRWRCRRILRVLFCLTQRRRRANIAANLNAVRVPRESQQRHEHQRRRNSRLHRALPVSVSVQRVAQRPQH